MALSNHISGATLDPTLGVIQNGLETTGNLLHRGSKRFKNQKNQLVDTLKPIPGNKWYKKIGNMPLALVNGALVPANALLGIGHKGLQTITAGRRLLGNSVRWMQKTILGQNVTYRPLIDISPTDKFSKFLSKGLNVGYFGATPSPTAPVAGATTAPGTTTATGTP